MFQYPVHNSPPLTAMFQYPVYNSPSLTAIFQYPLHNSPSLTAMFFCHFLAEVNARYIYCSFIVAELH